MVEAALRAPDHGRLKPWRFIAVAGEARAKLGKVFTSAFAARTPGATKAQLPLVLSVAAVITPDHPSVRVIDRQLAAGAAAMNLLTDACMLGRGVIWLTGGSCDDPVVKQPLDPKAHDFIAGWLHLVSPAERRPSSSRPDPDTFLRSWSGPA